MKVKEESDVDRLKFYLRTKDSREDRELLRFYHQEMGKIHARTCGKRLYEIGLREAWFAILEGLIIASGIDKDQVEHILQDILPIEKRDSVYIFHLPSPSSSSKGPLVEARYYLKSNQKAVQCQLCFRNCIIPEGGKSFCRVRVNKEGILYT